MLIEQYHLDNVCATKQGTKLDGPCPLGPKVTYELFVPPGKACTLLTDHLITGFTAQVCACLGKMVSSQTIRTYKQYWLRGMVIFQTLVGYHGAL